jgi:hypothetical protein
MTTAIIGTGGIGSVIARQLASGGEALRLASADSESARTLVAQIGPAAVVAAGNRDAVQGAGTVVLALRFTVLKGVIDEIGGLLAGQLVVVPSNPLTLDAHGHPARVLPDGQSSGRVVAGWLPAGARLAMAFGTLPADLLESASNRSPGSARPKPPTYPPNWTRPVHRIRPQPPRDAASSSANSGAHANQGELSGSRLAMATTAPPALDRLGCSFASVLPQCLA